MYMYLWVRGEVDNDKRRIGHADLCHRLQRITLSVNIHSHPVQSGCMVKHNIIVSSKTIRQQNSSLKQAKQTHSRYSCCELYSSIKNHQELYRLTATHVQLICLTFSWGKILPMNANLPLVLYLQCKQQPSLDPRPH